MRRLFLLAAAFAASLTIAASPATPDDPYAGLYGNTLTCIGTDWGCHTWYFPDGTMKSFAYKVVPGKYEFARDQNGQLIKLNEQDGTWSIEEGRLCRHVNRPTLCNRYEAGKKVGDHWSIDHSHGREDFQIIAGHQ